MSSHMRTPNALKGEDIKGAAEEFVSAVILPLVLRLPFMSGFLFVDHLSRAGQRHRRPRVANRI